MFFQNLPLFHNCLFALNFKPNVSIFTSAILITLCSTGHKVEVAGIEDKSEVGGDRDNFEKKRAVNEATVGAGENEVAEDKALIKVAEDQAKNKLEGKVNRRRHEKGNDGNGVLGLYQCNLCDKSFMGGTPKTHMQMYHAEKKLEEAGDIKDKVKDDAVAEHAKWINVRETVFSENKFRGKFKCTECDNQFMTEVNLKSHMGTHTGSKDFVCSVCSNQFKTHQSLARHQRIHEESKPYQCNLCGATFSQSSSIKTHIERRHSDHNCKECAKKFDNRPALIRHGINHHGHEKPYTCTECGKGLVTKREWEDHMRRHSGERPFECDRCGKFYMNKSGLRNHKVKHKIEDGTLSADKAIKPKLITINCEECGQFFNRKDKYTRHMIRHKGVKDFQCDQCDKDFILAASLAHHIEVVHEGKKETPFDCEQCGKLFMNKSGLRNHVTKHGIKDGTLSEERLKKIEAKKIFCDLCGKKFYQPSHLARHMKGHRGIKDFKCDQCEKAFTSATTLSQHIDVVHRDKKSFTCPECGHSFGRRGSLKTHMSLHSSEFPFKCNICDKSFNLKQYLKNHMAKNHIKDKNALTEI